MEEVPWDENFHRLELTRTFGAGVPTLIVQFQRTGLGSVRWGAQIKGRMKASDWRGRFSLVVRWSESPQGWRRAGKI